MPITLQGSTPKIKLSKGDFDIQNKPDKEIKKNEDVPIPKEQPQTEKLNKLKSILAEHNINLEFSRDETTNELVIKLVNNKTGEAIRQFPSEVSLKLAASYAKTQGQFINKAY